MHGNRHHGERGGHLAGAAALPKAAAAPAGRPRRAGARHDLTPAIRRTACTRFRGIAPEISSRRHTGGFAPYRLTLTGAMSLLFWRTASLPDASPTRDPQRHTASGPERSTAQALAPIVTTSL